MAFPTCPLTVCVSGFAVEKGSQVSIRSHPRTYFFYLINIFCLVPTCSCRGAFLHASQSHLSLGYHTSKSCLFKCSISTLICHFHLTVFSTASYFVFSVCIKIWHILKIPDLLKLLLWGIFWKMNVLKNLRGIVTLNHQCPLLLIEHLECSRYCLKFYVATFRVFIYDNLNSKLFIPDIVVRFTRIVETIH